MFADNPQWLTVSSPEYEAAFPNGGPAGTMFGSLPQDVVQALLASGWQPGGGNSGQVNADGIPLYQGQAEDLNKGLAAAGLNNVVSADGQHWGYMNPQGQILGLDQGRSNDSQFMTAAMLAAAGITGGLATGAIGGAGAGAELAGGGVGLGGVDLAAGAGGLGAPSFGGATGALGGLGAGGGGAVSSSLIPGISNGTLLNVGGNLLSGVLGSNAAGNAADAQLAASNNALALYKQMFDQQRADNMPLLNLRNSVLPQISGLLSNPSSITSDPGYQFGLTQGTNALNSGAAAKGMTYSGAQQKALTKFGQDYGSTKLNDSLNRLMGVAGLGQVGANNNQQAGNVYGQQGGNALTGAGNARASGYVGSTNAWNNALGGILNNYNTDQLLGRLYPGFGG